MNFKLFKNVLYNWAGLIGSMIYAFFMTPYIMKNLGDINYGLWNLIASVMGYIIILDFGIQSSVSRFITKFKAVDDTEHVNAVYSNAMAVYSIIAIGAICVGVVIAFYFDRVFNVPKESLGTITYIAIVMVIYSALELPLSVYGSVLYAYQRFDIINIVSVAALALQSILLLAFFKYKVSLEIFCYVIVFVGITKYTINFTVTHKIVGSLKFSYKSVSRDMLGQMLKFSGITFAAIIANNIIFKTDNIIIGIYLDPKAITMYSIGFMLTEYGSQIIGKMCNTLTPKFNEHHSRDETEGLNSLILSSSRFSTLIGIPMGLTALVIGKDFLQLWLGPGYEGAAYIMSILMCARMCGFPTASLYSMLYGIGQHHLILYTGITEAILNLGLSLYLVQKIGITGIAWGTFIPMLIGNVIFVLFVFNKLNLSVAYWLRKAILWPTIFSIVFFVIIFYLSNFFTEISWYLLIVKVMVIIAVYVILIIVIGISRAERNALKLALFSRFMPSGRQ